MQEENVKTEETVAQINSYVVPMYALVGFIINVEDAATINENFISLMKTVRDDVEIKSMFADISKRISEKVNSINPKVTAAVFVPNVFLPVKDENDGKIVNEFVEDLNKMLIEKMQQDTQAQKTAQPE